MLLDLYPYKLSLSSEQLARQLYAVGCTGQPLFDELLRFYGASPNSFYANKMRVIVWRVGDE